MSKFSNRGRDVALGIRERYLWELVSPSADVPVFKQLSGQFLAELHDRFLSPVYPFHFRRLDLRLSRVAAHHAPGPQSLIGGSILAVSACAWRDSPYQ